MSKRKGSCLKRVAIGCGAIVLLFVLAGFSLVATIWATKPETPNPLTTKTEDIFASGDAESLGLNVDNPSGGKPIKVIADLSKVNARFVPDGAPGQVTIDADYDSANYELKTKVVDKGDHIEYHIDFDTNRTTLSLLFSGMMDNMENALVIHMPSDRPLAFEVDGSMLEMDLDLTGLQVEGLDLSLTMGQMKVECLEPNSREIDTFHANLEMGEFRVHDFQNLNAKKVKFDGARGEAQLVSSGPLLRDTLVDIGFSMGEFAVFVDPQTQIDGNVSAFMGEYQNVRGDKGTGPKLTLNGSVTMGEIRVRRDTRQRSLEDSIYRVAIYDGGDAAKQLFYETKAKGEAGDVSESALNNIGYQLLRSKKIDEAIAIFELNVEIHPDYANGYDSLAEGHLEAGHLDESIEFYAKALEIDPEFVHAARMLGKVKEMKDSQESH